MSPMPLPIIFIPDESTNHLITAKLQGVSSSWARAFGYTALICTDYFDVTCILIDVSTILQNTRVCFFVCWFQYLCTYTYIHALHCIALHCIALHCIALHYIALHYITLHYITLHTYIHICHICYRLCTLKHKKQASNVFVCVCDCLFDVCLCFVCPWSLSLFLQVGSRFQRLYVCNYVYIYIYIYVYIYIYYTYMNVRICAYSYQTPVTCLATYQTPVTCLATSHVLMLQAAAHTSPAADCPSIVWGLEDFCCH